jgi:hypothetical protein
MSTPEYERLLARRRSAFTHRLDLVDEREAMRYLERYVDLFDVRRNIAFHQYGGPMGARFVSGWFQPKREDGSPKRLVEYHLLSHLTGGSPIAIGRPDAASVIIVDIDNHGNSRVGQTVFERYVAVDDAFRNAPHLVIRSSRTMGVHVYYFLDRAIPVDELNSRVTNHLVASVGPLKKGILELYPQPGTQIRLPLGRGSMVLDEYLAPITRRFRESFFRALRDGRELRHRLDDLAPRREPVHGRGVADRGVREVVVELSSEKTATEKRSRNATNAHHAAVAACEQGVSAPGQRHREGLLLLWDLRIRRGMIKPQCIAAYDNWLTQGAHQSKDLTGPKREQFISQMRKNAVRYIDHLEQRLAEGSLREGRPQVFSLASIISSLRHRPDWRIVGRSALTSDDRSLIAATVLDPWLRRHLETLIGLLRLGTLSASRPIVSLPRAALQLAIGGRKPPMRPMRIVFGANQARTLRRKSGYAKVVEAAVHLELLVLNAKAIRHERCAQYVLHPAVPHVAQV